jgi:hypothetical protein
MNLYIQILISIVGHLFLTLLLLDHSCFPSELIEILNSTLNALTGIEPNLFVLRFAGLVKLQSDHQTPVQTCSSFLYRMD